MNHDFQRRSIGLEDAVTLRNSKSMAARSWPEGPRPPLPLKLDQFCICQLEALLFQ